MYFEGISDRSLAAGDCRVSGGEVDWHSGQPARATMALPA